MAVRVVYELSDTSSTLKKLFKQAYQYRNNEWNDKHSELVFRQLYIVMKSRFSFYMARFLKYKMR